MYKNKIRGSKSIKQYKTLYRREGRNAFKAPMKMACNIITSNCCSLDTLTLILFKPLGNKCFKSRAFGTLELAGVVRSLRKGKGKVSSKQKELNNQFKISFYVDRQPLIPTFLTLALYVDFFFFFQHSLTRWIFATADQQRVSDLSECTRLEPAELLSNSPLLPFLALSSSLRQLAPPLSSPLHVIPKEQKKEKENKQRRASKHRSEHRKKKGGLKTAKGDKKDQDGHPQNAAIAEIFQRHWLGSVSLSVGRDFSTGGSGQHLGGTSEQPTIKTGTPPAAWTSEAAESSALYPKGKVSPTHSHHRQCACTTLQTCLFLTCTCF